jgi:ribonuclease BN (tRNA processing enzyme)
MQARLLFLGTGGDSFIVGKQIRASGGIMINIDSNQFHVDPGPGALVMAKMMGLNLRETTALFVTGNDLIRANDVNAVIGAMTHEGSDKKGVLVCPSALINGSSIEMGAFINKFYHSCVERTISVDNTSKIGINDIDIEIISLDTPQNISCGYKFITPNFSLAYIPDTGFNSSIGEAVENTDILVLSVQDPRSAKRKEHLNSEDAEKIIKKANPQLAVITGFGTKMSQSDPLYEAREIQRATGIQVIAAKDGMTINPMSFTTSVRQKNLGSYQ